MTANECLCILICVPLMAGCSSPDDGVVPIDSGKDASSPDAPPDGGVVIDGGKEGSRPDCASLTSCHAICGAPAPTTCAMSGSIVVTTCECPSGVSVVTCSPNPTAGSIACTVGRLSECDLPGTYYWCRRQN